MVNQTPQIRLLTSLLKSTKDYNETLTSHLVVSHTSLSGLQAYASASSPATAASILGVADALKGADDALARYASEVDHWRERLKEVKSAEEDVANILRDRDILVTRLIKASSKKPTKDSIINPPSPTSSVTSLGLSGGGSAQQRMANAQAELQGCEQQLAEKQRQLEQIRSIAIRDGLEQRCHALIRLGAVLSDKGNEGVRALQDGWSAGAISPSFTPNGVPPDGSNPFFRSLPPRPTSPSDTGSLAPSQSASQLGEYRNASPSPASPTSNHVPPRPARHPYRAVLMPPSPSRPEADIKENPEEDSDSSDHEDNHGPLQVVENQPRKSIPASTSAPPAAPTQPRRSSLSRLPHRQLSSDVGPAPARGYNAGPSKLRRTVSHDSSVHGDHDGQKKRGFFGTVAGLFRGKPKPVSTPVQDTFAASRSGGWTTRTDRNIADARKGGRASSSDDDGPGAQNLITVENGIGKKGRAKSPSVSKPPTRGNTITTTGSPSQKKLVRSNSVSTNHVQTPLLQASGTSTPVPAKGKAKAETPSAAVSRSGTVKSATSTKSKERVRAVSLNSSSKPTSPPIASPPVVSAPRQLTGTMRSNSSSATDQTIRASGAKPLRLTAATPDPNAWLSQANAAANGGVVTAGTTGGASVKRNVSNASSAASGAASATSKGSKVKRTGHSRAASLDVTSGKGPNLMTLVEGVAAERQRAEIIGSSNVNTVIASGSGAPAPKMMLPSEYMKVTSGPGAVLSHSPSTGSQSQHSHTRSATTTPVVALQPPTPDPSKVTSTDKGKKRMSEPAYLAPGNAASRTKAGEEYGRHTPPPRSASPLRSAMRHGTGTGTGSTTSSAGTTPASATVPPMPVLPPVPTAPPLIVPLSFQERPDGASRRDSASTYATARTDSDEEAEHDDDDSAPTPTKLPALTDNDINFGAMGFPTPPASRIVPAESVSTNSSPIAKGGARSVDTGPSPPSTEVSATTSTGTGIANGSSNPTRRKSVRLNVPNSPNFQQTPPSSRTQSQSQVHSHAHFSANANANINEKPLPLPSLGTIPTAPSLKTSYTTPQPKMPPIPSAPSLKQSVAQPPPQSEPEPAPSSSRAFAPPSAWDSQIAEEGVRDMWADTSEEDEDYKAARKSMTRAVKHEKAAYAEAAALLAPKSRKRESHKVR